MLSKDLLDILVCPKCKGDLEYKAEKDQLICHRCRLIYPIRDDIPIMLIDEAQSIDEAQGGNEAQSKNESSE